MKKICISKDWKFKNLTKKTPYESIDLPHDYQIKEKRLPEGLCANGCYPDTVGRYVKHLSLTKGRHYILDIDGAYMCAQIMFNEQLLAMHPYGYTPFLVDLTPHVFDGMTNKLAITTTPLADSTRWYSGNGIYRDVFLFEGGDIRIEPWDLFISTKEVQERSATIRIKYTVSADHAAQVSVHFSVQKEGIPVASLEQACDLPAGKSEQEALLEMPSPLLWDPEHPHLYMLKTEIKEDGVTHDESEHTFGIRTVTADAQNGLLLNGKQLKLRGGCIHHDHGELGAAAFPAAEERKVRLLKQVGFNAIRCAHNPPSLAFLEVCDRLGMIVMDEAFDVWNIPKRQYDYHLFFADWWARDISYMVLRDRNHPCVISYSIGNEILEINGTSGSAEIAKNLSAEIRKYDDTRFVTSGIQKGFAANSSAEEIDPEDYRAHFQDRSAHMRANPEAINAVTASYEAPLDIIGTNYYFNHYALDHETYPQRVLWGSETVALNFYKSWKATVENSYVLGDFTWTAYDNMGEAGAGRSLWGREMKDSAKRIPLGGNKYPWRNCYQGDYDLCGFRRPQSYFRESIWREETEPRIFVTHPEHFGEPFVGTNWHWYDVDECWSYDDRYIGRPIKAETYTSAEKIEWFVNGERVGESAPVNGIASVNTVYHRGNIRAVAYKNGRAYAEYTLHTAGPATSVLLRAEKDHFAADGRDLCYVPICLADREGRPVVNDDLEITCHVHGAELLALFSGDPKTTDDPTEPRCHTFKGRALAILRTKTAGEVCISVYANGFAGSTLRVRAIAEV